MRVHVIQTGRLVGNETLFRSESPSSVFRRRKPYEYPVYSYVLEHAEGLIVIDTGLGAEWQFGPVLGRLFPSIVEIEGEIGPQMKAKGLDPADVRKVLITHLDPDHVGGAGHFPHAEIWVHRREYAFASTPMGKFRQRPRRFWPAGFDPELYDLDDHAYGPFPQSKALTDSGDIRLVPIGGHTPGQVGAIVETEAISLFFVADHMLRQDWFLEDHAAGRITMVPRSASPELAAETTQRIRRFIEEAPTVLAPAHDAEAPTRLTAMAPLDV